MFLRSKLLAGAAFALTSAGLGISSSASASALFSYTGSTQTWVAPATGDYRITATGAAGVSANTAYLGGRGAEMAGTFELTKGSTYYVAVGGMAQLPSDGSQFNGGGGGGTFFVDSAGNPLLVAGGGGGTRRFANQNGTDASITEYGYTGSGTNSFYTPVLKSTDLGLGGQVSAYSYGSGGAGFYGDGASDWSIMSPVFGTGGHDWAEGLAGGISNRITAVCSTGNGGFGGGGAGAGCGGGGGGGGYSGGDGGYIAGGGGSYDAGINPYALAGVGTGNGSLEITELTAGVPEPATWAMLILGVAMVGVTARRRRQGIALAV